MTPGLKRGLWSLFRSLVAGVACFAAGAVWRHLWHVQDLGQALVGLFVIGGMFAVAAAVAVWSASVSADGG